MAKYENRRENGILRFVLGLCLGLGLFGADAKAQVWRWAIEDVDSSGKYTSIAVDNDGNVHLSYYNDDKGVRYAFRPADRNNSQWFVMTIDRPDAHGNHTTGIAVGPDGNPYICYTPGMVRYAHWDGKQWLNQQIAPNWGTVEYTCQVGVTPAGKPYVIWYQYASLDGSNYLHIRGASLEDGVWMARTIDFDQQTGKWNSMVVDAKGVPHITYDSYVDGAVKYAYWDGNKWQSRVIESRKTREGTYNRGMGNSLALGRDGQPMVAYYDDESLKFAKPGPAGWLIETLDSAPGNEGWVNYRSGIAVDSHGHPHIAYDDSGFLRHAYWDGTAWHVQTIANSGREHTRYCAIGINKLDVLFISYRDPSDGSLKVAVGKVAPSAATAPAEKQAVPHEYH
jgi:hypothetical protein